MTPQDQRDQLFERAQYGEITGDEADAEAVSLGLGSLSHTPAHEEYRPEAESRWTITMAVAWISYLDLDEVRNWWEPYLKACTHWIWRRWRVGPDGAVQEGWFLEGRSRPTLALLSIRSAYDRVAGVREQQMTVEDARQALWIALREGFFVASGIDFETEHRVEIPALDWNELVPVQGKGEVDEVRRGLLGSGYRDVLLPAKAIQFFWRKPKEKHDPLPPVMPPVGDGYMPLYCAAQWIATEGGAVDFDPADTTRWQPAFDQLLGAIASEKIRVVGLRSGAREPVPSFHFAGCVVDYPHAEGSIDMMLSESIYLRSYPYVDEEHWRKGFDDALTSRQKDHWTQLMVERGDVRQRWPFAVGEATKTGAPGRPALSMHLILDELERRADNGTMKIKVGEESVELVAWLRDKHPQSPRPKPKTVENQIRDRFRTLQAHPK
ncbi:hypothetical protein LGH82_18635 [Mesorhizobium sp. PAMC28654]|uniref:hypothetical protein n=1 Tax=Mesorhizobium sp. PAMC28654 TaxID=2880934 RepID=UPI001D09C136|nr:hypothetical protein [Mesorhizobium sp. PAMC28654]UDL87216.1 hypothetical protein LGH82_18635 [Mesorhizobium sp. PAMC28654]